MSKQSSLLPVYRRADITMTHGVGAHLFDENNTRYLDFASGIAVNVLGHSHPALVEALTTQAQRLWHCSNLTSNDQLEPFASALVEASGFADNAFLCSSGTEAVECAIKMVRRFHYVTGSPERIRIIASEGAFHGRTTGALSACSHSKSREGFEPLLDGFDFATFNDIAALEAAITPQTAGIMLEPIQGEGGIREHGAEYLQAARALADEHGILLFFDEIQCGYGRTGDMFAHMTSGIAPDILTCAKGIGGGFPLAATLATTHASQGLTQGTHGSTYGSNPLACAVGSAVLNTLKAENCLSNAKTTGAALRAALMELTTEFPELYTDVRGRGMLLGIVVKDIAHKYPLAEALRSAGLLTAPAVTDVIRIFPPLIIDQSHIDEAMAILRQVSTEFSMHK